MNFGAVIDQGPTHQTGRSNSDHSTPRLTILSPWTLDFQYFQPEIYQEMILEIAPRKMECMFIYLQPNYRAEIRMESRTSDTVAAMMRRFVLRRPLSYSTDYYFIGNFKSARSNGWKASTNSERA